MLAVTAAAGGALRLRPDRRKHHPGDDAITRAGVVERDGEPTGRVLPVTTPVRLQFLASKERFTRLPATIPCTGVLPDVATGFVVYRRHRVREHGGCNVRFTTLYNTLYRVVGVE